MSSEVDGHAPAEPSPDEVLVAYRRDEDVGGALHPKAQSRLEKRPHAAVQPALKERADSTKVDTAARSETARGCEMHIGRTTQFFRPARVVVCCRQHKMSAPATPYEFP